MDKQKKYLAMLSMTRSGHNFIKENILSWFDRNDVSFLNLESYHPATCLKTIEARMNPNQQLLNTVVVRDLLNWLSSYMKMKLRKPNNNMAQIDEYIKLWDLITKEAYGETNHLGDKTIIVYEDFKLHKDYRKSICKNLGGKYNEKMLNHVPHNGKFSSFDGQNLQGKGNKMLTEMRYKHFIGTPYQKMYLDYLRKHSYAVETYLKHMDVDKNKKELIIDKL